MTDFPDPVAHQMRDMETQPLDQTNAQDTRPGGHSAKNARQAGASDNQHGSGETPMVETPAMRQVTWLRCLAAHLEAHPHLPPVTVPGDEAEMSQLVASHDAADLLDWAQTLINPTATVKDIEGDAFVYITGSFLDIPWGVLRQITVWTVVPHLLDQVGPLERFEKRPLPLHVLRGFAAGIRTVA